MGIDIKAMCSKPLFGKPNLTVVKGLKFTAIGGVGLGINSLIQVGLRDSSLPAVTYILVGNMPGVIWNFIGNAIWTFRR